MSINSVELSPGIMSLLPLFYIGWSDSVLSPSEIKVIHHKIQESTFLTDLDKEYLIKYTNPKNPPNKEVFTMWAKVLQDNLKTLKNFNKEDLVNIGLELAKLNVDKKDLQIWNDKKTIKSIESIQKMLGLQETKTFQIVFGLTLENNKKQTLDVNKISKVLHGDNDSIIQRIKTLLMDPYYIRSNAESLAQKRAWTLSRTLSLAKQGLGSFSYDMEYGGKANSKQSIAIFETLAYGDLSVLIKFGVQFGLFGGAVHKLGTKYHHDLYLKGIGKGEILGCFAMTETGHGSNVRGLQTTAIFDKHTDTIIVNTPDIEARKEYIGNAMDATLAVVFCQLWVNDANQGIHAIVVPLRDINKKICAGVNIEDCGYKMGLNGVDNGKIWFDNVRVPRSNLLDKFGKIDDQGIYQSSIQNPNKRFFTMVGALVAGRISVGIASINTSKKALTIATKYSCTRRQFAPKEGQLETLLIDYPSHQRRLFPRIAKTYVYYVSLSKLSYDYAIATDKSIRQIESKAAGLKALATWHNTDTINECRELCGGKGYLSENRIDALSADTNIFTTFEGDNTVLLQLVAKSLLTNFKNSFSDNSFIAVLRYLSEKVNYTLTEMNPIYGRNSDVNHLLDAKFHLTALKYREDKLLFSVIDRMKKYLNKKIGSQHAFLKCQNHMISLAKAHIERLAYIDFHNKVQILKDSKEKEVLKSIQNLFALTIIENNKGWYLETGYIESNKAKAIRRVVDKLCYELSRNAVSIVDSWQIPNELIHAEILN